MDPKTFLKVILILMTTRALGLWNNRFLRLENQTGNGVVLSTQKVPSLVRCGSLCDPDSCEGINVLGAKGDFTCITLASVGNLTEDLTTNFYCAGCYRKGEKCSKDDHCTLLTENSRCDPTSGLCACVSWCMDDGPKCVIRPVELGGSCEKDEQCLALTNYSICDSGICKCEATLVQNGQRCKYDYAGSGFTSYNGRWVLIDHGSLTWNQGETFCQNNRAYMMRPRSSSEWSWMKSVSSLGFFLGIDDKATEGVFVWNDGTPASGDSVIQWKLGFEGYLNNLLLQCAGVNWVNLPPTPAAEAIGCGLPFVSYTTICESIPELV